MSTKRTFRVSATNNPIVAECPSKKEESDFGSYLLGVEAAAFILVTVTSSMIAAGALPPLSQWWELLMK